MNTTLPDTRQQTNDSTVSALSLVLVLMILSAILMIAGDFDLMINRSDLTRHEQANRPTQDQTDNSDKDPRMAEIDQRFQQALMMLHAKQYEHAATAFNRVITLSPRLPEAYVNMGYAMLGLERYEQAQGFFSKAIDLRPYQGNAYWGLAISYEGSGDLSAALGAMRTYIHLAPPDDPYVRRARSALWEWENALTRGPLPEEEKEFLEKGAEMWEYRNSPERDLPEKEELDIEVRKIQ